MENSSENATTGAVPWSRPGKGTRISGAKSDRSRAVSVGRDVRKQPRQERSIEMVETILQAAAEIFAKCGYARATTNRIAKRAGVSIGSLYQYFPNKDCLLVHLLRRHRAELRAVVEAALARLADPATPIDDAVRGLLREVVALHETNPALTAALSDAVLRESPSARDARKDEDGVSRLMSSVLAARADVRRGDHDVMAAVLNQATSQLTRWLVHDAPPELDRRTLHEETVQLLLRYLKE